ncbi:hypothetical protein FHT40_000669 [Mycolicibacterium sp. BK556]|nr:hypothetical protein [Mycolicibacterium sp. BK556]MBB3630790.1 hypothetical protein [Mycolicibacterium sp. BK607]MBB3748786.1 hypothetical protein [Mycolicibacterium sp. BK634]TDO15024.1 hypothetical protein EV580_3164 [Mycobacterium sp. BK086]
MFKYLGSGALIWSWDALRGVHNFVMGWGILSRRKARCGICNCPQTVFVGRDTFTCRQCKKTLPIRLAIPVDKLTHA